MGDKPRSKKGAVGSKGKQRVGWGKLTKSGRYKRGKKYSKYDIIRDARKLSEYKPENGKPFSGDSRAVYYVVHKKSGRVADKRVWTSQKAIPKKYKDRKKYRVVVGWV